MRRKVRSGTTLTLLLIAMLTLAFNRAYGEARSENALCVVETTDGGYALTGVTETFGAGGGDFWLVKTDSAGNMEWSKTYGGVDYEVAHSVIETGNGGYALTGFTGPYPNWDFWLVKVDSSGNMEWHKKYGGVYYGEWILYAGLASSVVIVGVVIAIYVKRIKT
jgi:hypothetical protein